MRRTDWIPLLEQACKHAGAFLTGLPDRPVVARTDASALFAAIDGPVPEVGQPPAAVLDELVRIAEPGITASPSGRFFGWVIGGTLPSAIVADWMTTAWDQNATSGAGFPAAAALDQVATRWIAELLALPATSGALVTGGQMANFSGLALGRHDVLRRAGVDLDEVGLAGAPPITVVVGAERHNTVDKALRMLGIGTRQVRVVAADAGGRMRAAELPAALAGDGPLLVCAQAGNVNGGAIDPLADIAAHVEAARARRPVWLHIDGAFGLWARAAPSRRALADGAEAADSWSTDAHKWLNTPFDCGVILTRHADTHYRALRGGADYLPQAVAVRNPFDHAPELSRRARGFTLWAALRELGRAGVAELVERTCAHARAIAAGLAAVPGVVVMNDVQLNQLVVQFRDPAGRDDDAHTRAVVARTVADGTCYVSGSIWRGVAAMRISVSNWTTDEDDVARTVAAIAAAHRA